jgi:glutamate racemase
MIGVFDSGLGGLTALKELRRVRPDLDILYYADTARIPYGTRSPSTILRYGKEALTYLMGQGVDQILIACGTVSSVALPTLAPTCPLPLWGVIEPACEKAYRVSKTRRIGVIATAATIETGAFQTSLKRRGVSLLWSMPCPLFVPLVENGHTSKEDEITRAVIRRYLEGAKRAEIDTLILGCTHFPLLAAAIHAFLPHITLIGAGEAAAHALCASHPRVGHGALRMVVSDAPRDFRTHAESFLGSQIPAKIELREEK